MENSDQTNSPYNPIINPKYSIPFKKPLYFKLKDVIAQKVNPMTPKLPLFLKNIHVTVNQKLFVIAIITTYVVQNTLEVIG
ncbi:unnamed protein product (macronuclear) [Paramecium tetraurelia]|uniref:Uncharacterized protein n=1 Tax=Paramecium tetraurelia TaxID=5888 RepID=A0D5B0_PARTE|nr:uncharacterized protein GSPATT00013675001 [Paramecium tetraurelia]CAK78227.1 unnamed protein product [Paramecium tetraurelia]|eukprot:XP_001445624.1 hypothetical protein (macronuclear) [Paramecium tetraurelia strain d4-2]